MNGTGVGPDNRRVSRGAHHHSLADTFSAVWVHQLDDHTSPPITIVPDATIDLQWIDGRFRVAGPDKEPHIESPPAGTVIIGFRFRPGAAASWLGVPANEILGERFELDRLWGTRCRELSNRVKTTADLGKMVRNLERALGIYMEGRHTPDVQMGRAFAAIDGGLASDAALVPFLIRHLQMSERTLRRRFDHAFGYGPKTLDRILRFQRFRRLQQTTRKAATALLAMEAGYADQAHLIRESRRLTGLTPLAWDGRKPA